jgi:hypothetical protein
MSFTRDNNMNTNKIFNVSLVIAGLVAIAGSHKFLGFFSGFGGGNPEALYAAAVYPFVFSIGFAIWLRVYGRIPSRDTLRRAADMKRMASEAGASGGTWQVDWPKKISWTVFSGAIAVITVIFAGAFDSVVTDSIGVVVSAILVFMLPLCFFSAIYVACYATLFLVGKAARKALPGFMTDNREAFASWATVVIGIGIAIYFPATRDFVPMVAPLAILAGWIREVDILRTDIPFKALMFMSTDILSAAAARNNSSDFEDEDEDEYRSSRLRTDQHYRMRNPAHPISQVYSGRD